MALIKKYKGKGTSSPLAEYTVKREIDVLGQGRARRGVQDGVKRENLRASPSKMGLGERVLVEKYRISPKKSSNMKKRQDHADFCEEEGWQELWRGSEIATWTPRSPCENVDICR